MENLDPFQFESHLSRIETHWTAGCPSTWELRRSRGSGGPRAALGVQYGGGVRRYLLASVRDVDAADDLCEEFALRFLRGDFKNANPGRGRFRDFVKRAVYNLMVDYHHLARPGRARSTAAFPSPRPRATDPLRDHDSRFLESWRDEL